MSTQSHKDVELGGIQARIDRIRAVGIDEGLYRLRMEAEISAIVVGVEAYGMFGGWWRCMIVMVLFFNGVKKNNYVTTTYRT